MSAATQRPVYIGIRGTVLALDRGTGEILWEMTLKSTSFVNLVLDGPDLLATTAGEIFCLDAATGRPRWHNPLRGYGFGIVTVATTNSGVAPAVEEMDRETSESPSSTMHQPNTMSS